MALNIYIYVSNKVVRGLADKFSMKKHFFSVMHSLALCTDCVKKQFQKTRLLLRI